MQREFQNLGQIEIAGEVVVLLAERAHFHAAARSARARIFHRLALPHQFLHDQIGVEHRRLPEARADDLGRALHEAIGILLADLHRRTGLQQPHVFDHVEEEVGHVVDGIGAIDLHAAGVDLREVGVGAALGRSHAHFGRRGLVVELDPEALQQLFGLIARQRPGGHFALIERIQMLIEMAGAEGIPRVEFGGDAQVHEPVILQRFPEVARRLRGHVRAHFGDALQFLLALRIAFLLRQFARLLRVSFTESGSAHRRTSTSRAVPALSHTLADR